LTKLLASKGFEHIDNVLTNSVENKKLQQAMKNKPRPFFATQRDSIKFKAPEELNSDSAVTLPQMMMTPFIASPADSKMEHRKTFGPQ
jgi:hypothetical protein